MGHRRFLGIGLLLILVAGAAWAQGKATGALTGKVSDESGVPLPGVSVEIRGSTLIGGVHALVTDKAGRFRLPEIPPGIYDVTVSLQGFQTVKREGLAVTLGNTIEVPISLRTETVSETVEVIGEAPAIDVTSSASVTNLSNDILQNLPTARFQPNALNLAPGINQSSAYGGGDGSGNSYQIDGVDVSDPQAGTPWAFVNYNIIKEVQLVGLGAPAEYGGFTGVVFNSVTQSGGNKVKGLAETLFSNHSLTSNNIDTNDPSEANLSSPTIKKSTDSTVQLGGPIAKDKVWYFLSGQLLNMVSSNGGPDRTEKDPRAFGKFTWQATQSSDVEAWLEWDRFDVTGRGGSSTTPLESTVKENAPEFVWNVSNRTVLSENTILTLAEAGYNGFYYLDPQNGFNIPGHIDGDTGLHSQNSIYFYKANRSRNQLNASLSHYASDFLKGDHDFKFGMEYERAQVQNRYGYTTGVWYYDHPSYGYTTAYHGHGYDVHATNNHYSAYAQDAWRVSPRLTLNPGLRIDVNRGDVKSGLVYKSNPVAPRLGFAWDLAGNGKTLVKAHFGRYYEGLYADYYYWVDPGAFQTGFIENIFPDGSRQFVAPLAGGSYAIDPNLKQPYLDQFILGVDRELVPGITVSGTLVYRENHDLIETVSRDGQFVPVTGEVGVKDASGNWVGTGQHVTLFDYLNPGTDTLIVTNPNILKRTYKGVILAINRRLKDNWQFNGSYVYSQTRGNSDNLGGGVGGDPGGPSAFLDTPNSLVNAQGNLTHDQTNQVKLQGTYFFTGIHLSLSGAYTYYTGDTWTPRTTCLLGTADSDPNTGCHIFPQGTVRYFADPRGSQRLPAWNQLDLRGEWQLPISRGDVGLFLDIFNVTNQGVALSVSDRVGTSTFGQPTTFSTPRNYRLGLRYVF